MSVKSHAGSSVIGQPSYIIYKIMEIKTLKPYAPNRASRRANSAFAKSYKQRNFEGRNALLKKKMHDEIKAKVARKVDASIARREKRDEVKIKIAKSLGVNVGRVVLLDKVGTKPMRYAIRNNGAKSTQGSYE